MPNAPIPTNEIGTTKEDWIRILDTMLMVPVRNIDCALDDVAREIGRPKYRRQVVMFIPVLVLMLVHKINPGFISDDNCRNSIAMIIVTLVGFINLLSLCRPFTKWRAGVCAFVAAGIIMVGAVTIFALNDMLGFTPALREPTFTFIMLGVSVALALLLQLFLPKMEKIAYKIIEKVETKVKK